MNVVGNFDAWASAFPHGLLPQVFQAILDEWPNFKRPDEKPIEIRITNRFVGHLKKRLRGKVSFAFYYREKLADPDSDSESGEIDIQVRHGIDPEVYFAFECKRLNLLDKSGALTSKASEYIGKGGMGCFLSGQYDGGGNHGGMLAYVMNDDLVFAKKAVNQAISKKTTALKIELPKELHRAEVMLKEKRVSQTKHKVTSGSFIIYHLFLPYSFGMAVT